MAVPRATRAGAVALAAAAAALLGACGESSPEIAEHYEIADVSGEARLGPPLRSWGARAGDLDGDNRDDLLISRHKRGVRLLRNAGGRFRNVTAKRFPPIDRGSPARRDRLSEARADPEELGFRWRRDRHDCLFGDVNVDGREDIYCTVGGFQGSGAPNPSELWLQRRDGTLADAARRYGVGQSLGRGRFATFIDANEDRWPDLFVGNEPGVARPSPNRLFVNDRGRRFRPAPSYGLDRELGADSAQAGDFDGDGFEDLLLCGAGGGPAVLFRNLAGRRFERANDLIAGGSRCRFAALADLDGDGALDLLVMRSSALIVRFQRDGRFGRPDQEHELARAKRLATGDATGDGIPEVYVVQSTDEENLDDALFVNPGERTALEPLAVPAAGGIGQAVTAIDHDGDGRVAFVVLNGKGTAPGPVRLIELRER